MNHSVLQTILCNRLTPQILHFLETSHHSVTVWDVGVLTGTFVIILYDDLDVLTALWVHDQCACLGGSQFHTHICPSELRRFWRHLEQENIAIRPPYRVTFSPTRARPYDCPHLNALRAERSEVIRDALRQRPCMLPGPLANLVVRPPVALQRLFPGLFALPDPLTEVPRPADLSLSKLKKISS